MSYFTPCMSLEVLNKIKSFEHQLNMLFKSNGISLRSNTGRRNALVSQLQEKAVAEALRSVYACVFSDGAPGMPDVIIEDIDKELECKLTSGSRSNGSISYSFQTDWATLCRKGKLDYLYIVANKSFDEFCVLFFEGLTSDDFYPPASGSRGKSRMKKKSAMKKCKVLFGDVVNLNLSFNKKYENNITELHIECESEVMNTFSKYANPSACMKSLEKEVISVNKKYQKKIEVYEERIKKWNKADPRYSIRLQKFGGQASTDC